MPYSKKAKTMTKAQMAEEMNRMAKEIAEMRKTTGRIGDQVIDRLENLEQGGFAFGDLASQLVAGLPLKEFAAKATIAFVYGYTLGVVGSNIITAMTLLMMPAWVHFVLSVLVVMCMLYIAFTTAAPVASFMYNGVSRLLAFVKREALEARTWVEQTAHDIRAEHAEREAARAASH